MIKSFPNAKFFLWALLGVLVFVVGILVTTVFSELRSSNQEITFTIVDEIVPTPELGIVADQKFKVLYVVPGGAADLAGMKKGDIIKAINAQELASNKKSMKTIEKIKRTASTTQSISLILTRGKREIKLEIQPAHNGGSLGAPTSTPVPTGMYYF